MRRSSKIGSISNSQIAEWLSREADQAKYPVQRALRAAGRAAFLWPEEVSVLVAQGRKLSELHKLGPFLEKQILDWLAHPPPDRDIPNIRQDFLTWGDAQKILAQNPSFRKALNGDLQMHTEWSDGSGTVLDMAKAGVECGYRFIAITDHGKKLKIAGGINETELREQGREIDAANEQFRNRNFRVLRSIELNLNPDGEGDMEPNALAELDIVIGAFHSSLRRTDDQTERYLKAIENPHVNILAHPRGRIYNYREGLTADWQRVFDHAARHDKALEIDSYPDRQDLNLRLLRIAKKSGARISIGTDAHHPWQLQFIDFGLAAAIKAGIPTDRILNFLPPNELLKWAAKRRSRKPGILLKK